MGKSIILDITKNSTMKIFNNTEIRNSKIEYIERYIPGCRAGSESLSYEFFYCVF